MEAGLKLSRLMTKSRGGKTTLAEEIVLKQKVRLTTTVPITDVDQEENNYQQSQMNPSEQKK